MVTKIVFKTGSPKEREIEDGEYLWSSQEPRLTSKKGEIVTITDRPEGHFAEIRCGLRRWTVREEQRFRLGRDLGLPNVASISYSSGKGKER